MDDLGRGDDVEDSFPMNRSGGMSGAVQCGLDQGHASELIGNFLEGIGGGGDILEPEGTGVVVGLLGIRGIGQGAVDE